VGVVRLLALVLAACSVPDLAIDGKHCPCSGGYTCDTVSQTCLRTSDAQGGTSCLGYEGPQLFAINFDDNMLDLTAGDGLWTASGGQAHQGSPSTAAAVAYATTSVPSDYRVAATLIPGSGTGLGVAFRVGVGTKTMYFCEWQPGASQLALGWTNNGGQPQALASVPVTGGSPTATVTIHAEARGTTLACCIDELPTATLSGVTDTHYANGQPGLVTSDATASFDNLLVSALPP
jgi:hypothetical protein